MNKIQLKRMKFDVRIKNDNTQKAVFLSQVRGMYDGACTGRLQASIWSLENG